MLVQAHDALTQEGLHDIKQHLKYKYMLCLIIRISSFRIELLVVLLAWLKAGDDNNSLCFEVCSSAYLAHNLIYLNMYLIQI